ncbi:MAG TPA: LysM domain-containing protein, partial [Candidatus Ozemobacteraceae bacterium]
MRFYRPMRARDPLLALLFSVGAAVLPVPATAQEYPASIAEEAGQTDGAALPGAGGLLQAPPSVVATPLEPGDVRPPIEPPAAMVQKAIRRAPVVNATVRAAANAAMPAPTRVAAPAAAPAAMRTAYNTGGYVVQPGDTAPRIAQKILGNANRWKELMDYNRIADPNGLRVGQRLLVPTGDAQVSVTQAVPLRAPAGVVAAAP